MSMNLAFASGSINFPFQTPTSLTDAVLKEPNTEKRLALIDEVLKAWDWPKDERDECLEKIRFELANGARLIRV